ncbi:MAG TPA: hypothetical protein VHX40_00715 [Acidimicrobiales bacterium]|jgi:hypothetical protein|nr:hypothetical protein [Acidimicrobiales bacterium]
MTIVRSTGHHPAAIGGVRTEDRRMDGMDGRSDDRAEEVVDVIAQLMPMVAQSDPETLDAALDKLVESGKAASKAGADAAGRANGGATDTGPGDRMGDGPGPGTDDRSPEEPVSAD